MALSCDVALLKGAVLKGNGPTFPDRCVVCGADSPGATTKITSAGGGWWTLIFWYSGGFVSARVPTCRWCGWRLRLYRYFQLGLLLFVSMAIGIWTKPYLPLWLPRQIRPIIQLVVGLGGALPILIWSAHFPPAFDIEDSGETLDYEFKDAEYAAEFRRLNCGLQRSLAAMTSPEDEDGEEDDEWNGEDDDVEEALEEDEEDEDDLRNGVRRS